jgi:glycosyltransferase involved in cell wall biosynthesis
MQVLYYHQYFTTPDGSSGTRSYEMAQQLIRRGHQVTMVCCGDERSGLRLPEKYPGLKHGFIDNIEVYQFNIPYSNRLSLLKRTGVFFKYALKSSRFALENGYDIVFATSTPLTAGIPGIRMKFARRKKPFVFEVRDLWPELPKAMGVVKNPIILWMMSVLEWLSYRCADGCIGLAPGIVEGIRKRSKKNNSIAMVPNGCDLDLFIPGDRPQLVLEGIKPNDFVAAFTGAHGLANGLNAVLDATHVLKKRNVTAIKIALIGDGNQKDKLKVRAAKDGLDNVLFYDPIQKKKLREITGSIDVGMQILANIPAFYYGTSPNKFFDYISAGRPVLVNYPGWQAELVNKHQCGIAVPPDDPEKFADALMELSSSKDKRIQMGQNARKLAEKEFSRDVLANQWVDFVEEVYKKYYHVGQKSEV